MTANGPDDLGATVVPGAPGQQSGPDHEPNESGELSSVFDRSTAQREAVAARLREKHPRWVVLWLDLEREFRAYPFFRLPGHADHLADTDADRLEASMVEAESAAARLKDVARKPAPGPSEP